MIHGHHHARATNKIERDGHDYVVESLGEGGRQQRAWGILTLLPDSTGMMIGMTTSKIAVSLPSELVEQAQRAVAEGRSPSVSAYVARALEEQTKLDDLASLLDEMLAETGGPLTVAERNAADEALGR